MNTFNTEEQVYTCFSIPMKEHEFEKAEAIIDDFFNSHTGEYRIEIVVEKDTGLIAISHDYDPCDLKTVINLTQVIVDTLSISEPITILWTDESECEGGKVTIRKNMVPEVFTPAIEVNK